MVTNLHGNCCPNRRATSKKSPSENEELVLLLSGHLGRCYNVTICPSRPELDAKHRIMRRLTGKIPRGGTGVLVTVPGHGVMRCSR